MEGRKEGDGRRVKEDGKGKHEKKRVGDGSGEEGRAQKKR